MTLLVLLAPALLIGFYLVTLVFVLRDTILGRLDGVIPRAGGTYPPKPPSCPCENDEPASWFTV
jgi:hypothetical protein